MTAETLHPPALPPQTSHHTHPHTVSSSPYPIVDNDDENDDDPSSTNLSASLDTISPRLNRPLRRASSTPIQTDTNFHKIVMKGDESNESNGILQGHQRRAQSYSRLQGNTSFRQRFNQGQSIMSLGSTIVTSNVEIENNKNNDQRPLPRKVHSKKLSPEGKYCSMGTLAETTSTEDLSWSGSIHDDEEDITDSDQMPQEDPASTNVPETVIEKTLDKGSWYDTMLMTEGLRLRDNPPSMSTSAGASPITGLPPNDPYPNPLPCDGSIASLSTLSTSDNHPPEVLKKRYKEMKLENLQKQDLFNSLVEQTKSHHELLEKFERLKAQNVEYMVELSNMMNHFSENNHFGEDDGSTVGSSLTNSSRSLSKNPDGAHLREKFTGFLQQMGSYYELMEKYNTIKEQNGMYMAELSNVMHNFGKERKALRTEIRSLKKQLEELKDVRDRNNELEQLLKSDGHAGFSKELDTATGTQLEVQDYIQEHETGGVVSKQKQQHEDHLHQQQTGQIGHIIQQGRTHQQDAVNGVHQRVNTQSHNNNCSHQSYPHNASLQQKNKLLEIKNKQLEEEIISLKLQMAHSLSMEDWYEMQLREMSTQINSLRNDLPDMKIKSQASKNHFRRWTERELTRKRSPNSFIRNFQSSRFGRQQQRPPLKKERSGSMPLTMESSSGDDRDTVVVPDSRRVSIA